MDGSVAEQNLKAAKRSLLSPQPLGVTCSCTVAVFVGELSRQQTKNNDGPANNVVEPLSDIKSLRPTPVLYTDEQSNSMISGK